MPAFQPPPQAISLALARRSIRFNTGGSGRVAVAAGDLREPLPPELPPPGGDGRFDLVTGTPPYIPLGDGGSSGRPQKTPCNLETRGGVEGYVAAAARALAPGGSCVVCMVGRRAAWGLRAWAACAWDGWAVESAAYLGV
jgi:tRNA1Val (adenine37-N6)-methyltransferase